MENLIELNYLVERKERLEKCGKKIHALKYIHSNEGGCLIIPNPQGCTLATIEFLIGCDKFSSIVEQFQGLLVLELHKLQIQAEGEIAKYQIIKKSE